MKTSQSKSIYLDGYVIEEYSVKPIHGYVGESTSYSARYPCPAPHPFANYQDVTGLYELKEEIIPGISPTESTRSVVAVPIQKEEGEKGMIHFLKRDWDNFKLRMGDMNYQGLINIEDLVNIIGELEDNHVHENSLVAPIIIGYSESDVSEMLNAIIMQYCDLPIRIKKEIIVSEMMAIYKPKNNQ